MSTYGNRMAISVYVPDEIYSALHAEKGIGSMSSFVAGILEMYVEVSKNAVHA